MSASAALRSASVCLLKAMIWSISVMRSLERFTASAKAGSEPAFWMNWPKSAFASLSFASLFEPPLFALYSWVRMASL